MLHLDINSLSLPRASVLEIAQGIRRSTSLLGVHLSGNSIKGPLLAQVRSIIKVQRVLDPEPEHEVKAVRDKQKELEKATREHGANELGMAERIELKKIKQGLYENELSKIETERRFDKLLIARKLLHPEIKGTDNWEEVRECWVCKRHIYSMVSFTRERARRHANRLSVNEQKLILKKADAMCFELDSRIESMRMGDPPLVIGTFTDWNLVEMQNEHEIARLIDKEYEDPRAVLEQMLDPRRTYPKNVQDRKLQEIEEEQTARYKRLWAGIIAKSVDYKPFYPHDLMFEEPNIHEPKRKTNRRPPRENTSEGEENSGSESSSSSEAGSRASLPSRPGPARVTQLEEHIPVFIHVDFLKPGRH